MENVMQKTHRVTTYPRRNTRARHMAHPKKQRTPEEVVHIRSRAPRRRIRRRRRPPARPELRPGEGASQEHPSRQRRGLVSACGLSLLVLLLLLLLLCARRMQARRCR